MAGTEDDLYGGLQPVANYYLKELRGEGKIGRVYRAERTDPADELACKIIPEGRLKQGWERELQKVTKLRGIPHVVQYHSHGSGLDKKNRPYTWVMFQFINGENLNEYLSNPSSSIDLAFIEGVLRAILDVLHACRAVQIYHGDLHEGNILVEAPDPRLTRSPRTIWISDFGYGGSHNEIEPKDDYKQTASIISALLRRLNPHDLNARDRLLHESLSSFASKRLLDADRTVGLNAAALLDELAQLRSTAERESAAASRGEVLQEPGDFLWAEALGYRVHEWKNLFVPEFLAAQQLLTYNITVLTGARGCGKTMAFRRLTALMDTIIGERSGVDGSERFVGFYLNCRDLVEAFPWLPKLLREGTQQQILHYFHLAWLSEVFKTIARVDLDKTASYSWLDDMMVAIFGDKYGPLPRGADVLSHVRAFLEADKERCRVSQLGKRKGTLHWPLSRMDTLDRIQVFLKHHVSWIGDSALFLFLDDYTVPIVTREVQRILNPIIFKRRSQIFFKVSTEAANSFLPVGLNDKPLELHQDFELLDLATESLHQDSTAKEDLLNKIFRPRIDRHRLYKGKKLNLEDVLGQTPFDNNELAYTMRTAVEKGERKRILYSGKNAFVGMWSSDIRVMVQMLTDMLREANGKLNGSDLQIPIAIQDRSYRTQGSEFLIFAESVRDPALWEKTSKTVKPGQMYGSHLKHIVEAFINVSKYEMTKGKLIGNDPYKNPRQAFRLEVVDHYSPTDKAMSYWEGLVRWHIFLQDWRGRSVRGMITPRLYLNRILIPYAGLTFSSHDHIQLTNVELISLLERPTAFTAYWKKKRTKRSRTRDGESPELLITD
jgi:hypothetical protein